MAQNYDRTDLLWTSRGDYFLGNDGDVMDTKYDPLRSLWQEIKTRVEADQGDWVVFPTVGGNLSDFIGEPNLKVTAESLRTRLISCLTANSFINNQDIKIKYLPIDRDKLLFRLSISVTPTAENAYSETLTRIMIYNYSDNNVYPVGG